MNPAPSPGKPGSQLLLRELAGQRQTKRHHLYGVKTVVDPPAPAVPPLSSQPVRPVSPVGLARRLN